MQNLATFAALPYPSYEVLLGVRDVDDAAYPTALAVARRWPLRFRVVVQSGEPGLNPKVNQLITLARAARNELLVISDSNTRVPPGYLDEIAAVMQDESVGLVTHPIVGQGDEQYGARLGSALDNMHLGGSITPALTTAKVLFGKDYVVGKSMALRWSDVRALGGFAVVKDVLAEDFVLGRLIPEKLGKRVVLARSVVRCVSLRRSLEGFVKRYARWSVMQHQCAGLPAYWGLLLLNPQLLVTLALLAAPGARHGRRVARVRGRANRRSTPPRDACCAGARSRSGRCPGCPSRICSSRARGSTASRTGRSSGDRRGCGCCGGACFVADAGGSRSSALRIR